MAAYDARSRSPRSGSHLTLTVSGSPPGALIAKIFLPRVLKTDRPSRKGNVSSAPGIVRHQSRSSAPVMAHSKAPATCRIGSTSATHQAMGEGAYGPRAAPAPAATGAATGGAAGAR